MSEIQREIADLRRQLAYHSRKYYVEDAPEISDASYDRMFRRLVDLETQYPEFDDPTSPTQRTSLTRSFIQYLWGVFRMCSMQQSYAPF